MTNNAALTVERLREIVNYESDTGQFFLVKLGRYAKLSAAGRYGRLQIWLDGRMHYAARCAWAWSYGEWPAGQVDHINGDHTDNRLSNLRVLTNAQNAQNRRRPRHNNSTCRLGVSFDRRSGRYRARIMLDGAMKSLGYYASADEAHAAYVAAKRELHPFWVE